MNSNPICRNLLAITLMTLMATLPLLAQAAEEQSDTQQTQEQHAEKDHGDDGRLYLPSDDAMADLESTLEAAKDNNKLALIILGANWCHDSRGLASRLQVEPLKSLVEDNYETLYVDVGHLSEGRDVIQSLGVPIYYATPTVLIIDPVTGKLVNEGNRHMWAAADSISMDDSISYFEEIAAIDVTTLPDESSYSAEQAQLMNDIDEFEQAQADRLSEAYLITGAMFDGTFDQEIWSEVGRFRNSVASDVDQLRAEVARRVADGETDIVLSYPQYPAWSWESEALASDEQ